VVKELIVSLYDLIINSYPELENTKIIGTDIILRNDSDGLGDYIDTWNYDKPVPEGLAVGKPS
jgi:hypothetical protein